MKKIVWIKKRLSNSNIAGIMQHWEDFFQGGHMQKLNNGNSPLIAVYHNYESDVTGQYDLLIWIESKEITWYESIEIAQWNYKEYKTEWVWSEPVKKLWQEIWNDKNIVRAYTTDYEVYSWDPKNPKVSIFVSIVS